MTNQNFTRFTCFTLFLLLYSTLTAQWKEEQLPSMTHGVYYYTGSQYFGFLYNGDDQIYTSTDGKFWQPTNPLPLTSSYPEKISGNGDTVVLHYGFDTLNVVYSTNRGQSWTVGATFLSPTFQSTYFNGRLFRNRTSTTIAYSDDFGTTWQDITNTTFDYYAAEQMTLHKGQLWAKGTSGIILHSSDLGLTWAQGSQPAYQAGEAMSESYASKNVLFLVASTISSQNYKYYCSTDAGATWLRINLPGGADGLQEHQNILYTFVQNTLMVSHDWGQTWVPGLKWFHVISDDLLWDGELASFDHGVTWEPAFFGFPNDFFSFTPHANSFHITSGANTILQAVDSSDVLNWKSKPYQSLNFISHRDRHVHIVISQAVLYYSIDDGDTWNQNNISSDYYVTGMHLGTIYFANLQGNQNFVTQDFGQTITPLALPGLSFSFIKANQQIYAITLQNQVFAAPFTDPTNFQPSQLQLPSATIWNDYFGLGDQFFCKTFSNLILRYDGVNWDTCHFHGVNLNNLYLGNSIFVGNNSQLLLLYRPTTINSSKLISSVDGGLNWVDISAQFPPLDPYTVLFQTDHNLYISFEDGIGHSRLFRLPSKLAQYPLAKGSVYYDDNQNGALDMGEKPYPNLIAKSEMTGYLAVSNTSGAFDIPYFAGGADTITTILRNPYHFVTTPTTVVQSTSNFVHQIGIGSVPNITDLTVDLTSFTLFRPGFVSTLMATIRNTGTLDAPSQFMFILDPNVQFVSSSPLVPSSIQGDTLWFQIPTIVVNTSFILTIELKADVVTPIGTDLSLMGQVITQSNDFAPLDNSSTIRTTVVGSFDPNDKAVEPENLHPDMVAKHENLYYTIRFQNTGNFPATFVRVLDTLDQNLNVASLLPVAASHPYTWTIRDRNILDVFFDNINLADSVSNEPASHGFIKFAIQADSTLQLGQSIKNSAAIYFDFNTPVITNTVQTEVKIVRTQEPQRQSFTFQISPNPGRGRFIVSLDHSIFEPAVVRVIDASGRVCATQNFDDLPAAFELPKWSKVSGTYFVHITTHSGKTAVRQLAVE
jgi:uncharacterized repeat protein (TIGR01451 family)